MGVNPQNSSQAHSVLSRIRNGMDVYDRENEHIGTVDEVHFGAATDTQLQRGTGPVKCSQSSCDWQGLHPNWRPR